MLFLLFQLGKDRYALEASHVVEVLPMVALKQLPSAPAAVAGIFNFRGQPVPVVDLCALTLGRPAREKLSTRIIIIRYPTLDGADPLVGLIAEEATHMMRREPGEFVNSGMKLNNAPWLGPMFVNGKEIIQWIREDRLLPPDVCTSLFCSSHDLTNETH